MEEATSESDDSPPILPLEMMEEILARLPAKALMRFKCVCSSWRSSISQPLFTLKHAVISEAKATTYEHSPHGESLEHFGVITTSQHHLKSCCIHSLYNEFAVNVAQHDHELLGRNYYEVVGTCHGLICFHIDHKHLYLWNPTIKLHMRLPNSDLGTESGEFVTYGFGYDESADDYKVVALLHQRRGIKTEAKIYSKRQGFWTRSTTCFPSGVVPEKSRSGIYIKGSLNWAATSPSSSSSSSIIISYDMSHDVFKEFPGPICCTRGCFTLTLGVLRGYLSAVCYCEGGKAQVWVMKEFGEGNWWWKLVSIPGLTEHVCPLWISNDFEVLLEFRSGLALYNCGNGRFHYPVSDSLSSCRDTKVYVKALVSPIDLRHG